MHRGNTFTINHTVDRNLQCLLPQEQYQTCPDSALVDQHHAFCAMQIGRNTTSASGDALAAWDIVASTPASSEQREEHDISLPSTYPDSAMTYSIVPAVRDVTVVLSTLQDRGVLGAV